MAHRCVAHLCALLLFLLLSRPGFAQAPVGAPNDPRARIEAVGKLYAEGKLVEAAAEGERLLRELSAGRAPTDPELRVPSLLAGAIFLDLNDYARAEPLLERALSLTIAHRGKNDPEVAVCLSKLGVLYHNTGRLIEAERAFHDALDLRERMLGRVHPDVAYSLATLAAFDDAVGDTTRALLLYGEAIRILEQAYGEQDVRLAPVLTKFAIVLRERGDAGGALWALERAIRLLEQARGPTHLDLAGPLEAMAELFIRRDPKRARSYAERVISILEQALGKNHPRLALPLLALTDIAVELGELDAAERHASRALALAESLRGGFQRMNLTQAALASLSSVKGAREKYADAEKLLTGALDAIVRAMGSRHPRVADRARDLASLRAAKGDVAGALDALAMATDISEALMATGLAVGSDDARRAYVSRAAAEVDGTVWLHLALAPQDDRAARLATHTLLRRKGRVLDAFVQDLRRARMSTDPETREMVNELASARARLSALGIGTVEPRGQAEMEELQRRVRDLESSVALRGATLRASAVTVTLEDIQKALRPGDALVEYALYRPWNPRAKKARGYFQSPRYAAYVIRSSEAPRWRDLGDAAALDADIARWRSALGSPGGDRGEVELARRLHDALVAPLAPAIGEAQRVLVSPDGELSLLPFAALATQDGRRLLDRYEITYVTTGRDLLSPNAERPRQGPVIVANPRFDAPASTTAPSGAPKRAAETTRSLIGARIEPLPGTQREAEELATLLPQTRLLTGTQASEAAVKALEAPSILHVASHGFFLSRDSPLASTGRGLELAPAAGEAPERFDNPLVRSGILLAGVAAGGDGRDDGLLTALEAAGLDLWGTELVVLSACETGVGKVRAGEGVYGLRRALLLAGSKSQLMSLWRVDDEGTRQLMVLFYRQLKAGATKPAALRQAQQALRKLPGRQRPYDWAAFVLSGDTASIDWSRLPPPPGSSPPAVATPVRRPGCACELPAGPTNALSPAAVALAGVLAGVFRRIRRRRHFLGVSMSKSPHSSRARLATSLTS